MKELMDFINSVVELLFSKSGEISGQDDLLLAVFAMSSAFMGVLVVLLDIILFYSTQNSALNLTHKGAKSLLFILLWGLGAGIGSFLGAAGGILQINRAACLTAGIGWPLILPRLIEKSTADEDEGEQDEEEEQ